MKTILSAAAAVIGLAQAASSATFGPLVTPQELSAALSEADPIILDIRGKGFAEGHVPGAISAPYSRFRGPKTNPGQLLEARALETLYESLGLEFGKPIVVVHEGKSSSDFGAAARVYWTLKSSGFTDLSVLNGGTLAWDAAGLPLEAGASAPSPTDLEITFSDEWTVTSPEVAELAESRGAVLVDARTPEFYEGDKKHGAAAQPGAAPGAVNYVFSNFFDGDSTEISSGIDVAAVKSAIGISEGDEIVSYCNTGHWAAINWFALSEIGEIDNVKLHPGSMVEYSNSGLPMMNTPGLLQNLKNQLLGDG